MKILFVANAIVGKKPGVSGGETRFLEMSRGFAKAGHEIHLLSSSGAKYLLKDFGITAKLHSISTNPSTGRWVFWLRLYRSIFQLPKSLKLPRFDIIYASSEQSYDVISAVRLRRRSPGATVAVAVHWLPPTPPWKRTGSSLFNSMFFWISERVGLYLAVLFADMLLPVSEATGDQLRAAHIPEKKFKVVECGVDFSGIQRFAKRVKPKYEAVFMKRIQQ
ncbi:glycosyltransferase family 4 protein, partial [Candidatus Berkelbacteria bacterium]|nr:glycosyltransferase family 4 protein [Candidatus Berkelbacteria bacterium]